MEDQYNPSTDKDSCPYDRGEDVKCLNCGRNWGAHHNWACKFWGKSNRSALNKHERYLTVDMQGDIKGMKVKCIDDLYTLGALKKGNEYVVSGEIGKDYYLIGVDLSYLKDRFVTFEDDQSETFYLAQLPFKTKVVIYNTFLSDAHDPHHFGLTLPGSHRNKEIRDAIWNGLTLDSAKMELDRLRWNTEQYHREQSIKLIEDWNKSG